MKSRLRGFALHSRTTYRVIIVGMIVVAVAAFLFSRVGQTALLVCCGGLILLAVVGILSERGMRR